MDRTLVAAVVGALLTVGTVPAFAARQDSLGRTVPDSTAEGWGDVRERDPVASEAVGTRGFTQQALGQMGRKLGRGLVNASTGWIELPKTLYGSSLDGDPVYGDSVYGGSMLGLAVGSLHGLWLSTVRTVAGVYEVATFPVPIPAGYAPVVRPTTVFTWEKPSLENPSSSWEARG